MNLKKQTVLVFFLEYNLFYFLVTNYHVVHENIKSIEIEIWNKNNIELNLQTNERYIKYFEKPKDITCIQIKENEINNITYLNYDLNYKRGYNQYLNIEALALGYPKGNDLSSGSGKIKGINKFEFNHNIPTDNRSSGSLIILFSTLTVIGIHKAANHHKRLNKGTFIGDIIKDINIDENKNNKEINSNQIIKNKVNNDEKKMKLFVFTIKKIKNQLIYYMISMIITILIIKI